MWRRGGERGRRRRAGEGEGPGGGAGEEREPKLTPALHSFSTLLALELAHNAFANVASQELGVSLKANKGLTYLDLSFNSLTPSATMVIAHAAKENSHLEVRKGLRVWSVVGCLLAAHALLEALVPLDHHLPCNAQQIVLDGNKLGRRGAESLMMALCQSRQVGEASLVVSMSHCDIDFEDPSLFTFQEPTGRYNLDLEKPCVRAHRARSPTTRTLTTLYSCCQVRLDGGARDLKPCQHTAWVQLS